MPDEGNVLRRKWLLTWHRILHKLAFAKPYERKTPLTAADLLNDRVVAFFASNEPPNAEDITHAFWGACHGGQRPSAQYLLEQSADINWIGWDELTPLDAAERSEARELVSWLRENGARSAADLR